MTYLSRKAHFPPVATAKEFALLLATVTLELWDACLIGSPPPAVVARYELMKDPKPGDLVLETTSCNRSVWPGPALGRLLFICKVKPRTEEEWVEAVEAGSFKMGSYRGNGPYWLVDPIDGSQRTYWENASFIRVPDPREPAIGPVVFTQESLRGSLADSGFELKPRTPQDGQ